MVKKFPAFYRTQMFITYSQEPTSMFLRSCYFPEYFAFGYLQLTAFLRCKENISETYKGVGKAIVSLRLHCFGWQTHQIILRQTLKCYMS
jgi:hypothetical protein